MYGKVTTLSKDVKKPKVKDKAREEEGLLGRPWSQSRSPCHLRSEPRKRSSPEPRRHWADSDPDGRYGVPPIPWLPSDEEEEDSQLKVSVETHRLIAIACTWSVSNDLRKRTQGWYNLPMVEATKMPRLDPVIKTLATQGR